MTAVRLRVIAPERPDARIEAVQAAVIDEARRLGADAAVIDDVPGTDDGDEAYLVVPEEFFARTRRPVDAILERSTRIVGLVLAPGGTPGFEAAAAQAAFCRSVLALREKDVAALSERHPDARLLELGYTPTWDAWGGAESERETSFLLAGPLSARAGEALARVAPYTWAERWRAHFVPDDTLRSRHVHALEGAALAEALARSRVLVDLDDSPSDSIDPCTAVMAMTNGAVIVSERRHGPRWAQDGEHWLGLAEGDTAELLAGLVNAEELGPMRRAARELVMSHPFSEGVRGLIRLAADALDDPRPVEVSDVPAAAREEEGVPGGWSARIGADELSGAATRRIEGRLLAITRTLDRLQRGLGIDDPSPVTTAQTPSYAGASPRVSVIVSLYNYGDVVREALDSVTRSVGIAYEILVQDDGSTDGSFEVVRQWADAHPDVPVLLVRRELNQGLPATRNDLAARARAPYLFSLDADNGVFPSCLARLAGALDADPAAAFAYSLIANRHEGRCVSLSSVLSWDPARLRRGNYIDAMAMLRKEAVEALGGWNTAMLFGWEDFELWARVAESGGHAAFVPQALSWYRQTSTSMLMGSRIDEFSLWNQVRAAAPRLMADREAPESDAPRAPEG